MRPAKKLTPPYAAYSTHLKMLERLRRHSMPDDLRSSTELQESLANSTFAQTLRAWRFLGLVDDQERPTDTLTQLIHASGEEYQTILRNILETSYSFVYDLDVDEPSTVMVQSWDELHRRFELQGATGSTVRRSISFFVNLAADAGIQIPDEVASALKDGQSMLGSSPSRKESVVGGSDHPAAVVPKGDMAQANVRSSSPGEMLLAKLPAFDPSWSSEERSAWLHSFDLVASIIKREKESGP